MLLPHISIFAHKAPSAAALLRHICDSDPELAEVSAVLQAEHKSGKSSPWGPDFAAVMEERLATLMADEIPNEQDPTPALEETVMHPPESESALPLPSGWRRANPTKWHPAPIGVYVPAC